MAPTDFSFTHVGEKRMCGSAFGCDLGRHRRTVLCIGEHDLGAFGRQRLGEDRAERGLWARGRAGDDRNLSVQATHRSSFEFQRRPACTSSG
jgi:hypothetical protein